MSTSDASTAEIKVEFSDSRISVTLVSRNVPNSVVSVSTSGMQNLRTLVRSNSDESVQSVPENTPHEQSFLPNTSYFSAIHHRFLMVSDVLSATRQSVSTKARTARDLLHAFLCVGLCTWRLLANQLMSRNPKRSRARNGDIVLDLLGLFGIACLRQVTLFIICPIVTLVIGWWYFNS
jgi:hypothetical protein